jgi:hypothetical protein
VSRKRIGDGPSPILLAEIIAALARRAEGAAHDGVAPGATAAELAAELTIPATQARSAAAELVRARCLILGRAPTSRHGDSGRYAQAFSLPAASAERGVARGPRLYPVALVVGAQPAAAHQLGTALRQAGVLPVAAGDTEAALRILEYLGFELVVLCEGSGSGALHTADRARMREAARRAGCGPVLVVAADGPAAAPAAADGSAHAGAGPINPVAFRATLSNVMGPGGGPTPHGGRRAH